jgi:hypothetical protein
MATKPIETKPGAPPTKQRVVFTFDNRSFERLQELAKSKGVSLAEVVQESLELRRALQQQIENGFTEIIVRNSKTDEERVLIIPAR